MKQSNAKSPIRKRIRTALTLLVALALVILAILLMVGKFRNRVTFFFGRAALWVQTDSMEDAIPAESYIRIRRATAAEVKVGDVITFYSSDPVIAGQLNTHRVEEIAPDGSYFITKGDHNITADATPVRAEDVVGIYEKNLPARTAVGRFFKTPAGLICTLLLMLGICTALYLPDILKAFRAESNQKASSKQAEIDRMVAIEVARLRAEQAPPLHEDTPATPEDPTEE